MLGLALLLATTATVVLCAEPNPPRWPPNVHIFGEDSEGINSTVQSLYFSQRGDLYDSRRQALFFKPGIYTTDIPVGYYTTVHGLGNHPADVSFTGLLGVHQSESGRNLIQFWRGVENIANRPTTGETVWSVSQASPLRRMIVDGNLKLGTAPNTQGSGGFVSGLQLTGSLDYTMQQQWISRNCELTGNTSYFQSPSRSVNFVYVGTDGAPEPSKTCTNSGSNPASPYPQQLVIEHSPLIAEKPFITIDTDGKFSLVTPRSKSSARGVQWGTDSEDAFKDGFEKVFVATNSTKVSKINSKLAEGLHVVLSPGIYSLQEPLRIGRVGSSHQVLLGLGLATLVPLNGTAAVEVADVPGVRVAGILLQAGPVTSRALMTVGSIVATPAKSTVGTANDVVNPIVVSDVYARVGGPGVNPVSASIMMEINASHVVLDNVWLWRADVENGLRTRDCNHSLVVNGHHVTAYGLAAEHTQSDNVVWNGEAGQVYFFQAELDGLAHKPNDKTPDFGPNGVSGYRVNAKTHSAHGVGVYCWFSSPGIVVQSAVKVMHRETVAGIVCPFQWTWVNANTPPHGNSTIEAAIKVVV